MKTLDEEHRLLTRLAYATYFDGERQLEIARRFGLYAGEGAHKGGPYGRDCGLGGCCRGWACQSRLAKYHHSGDKHANASMGLCPRGRDLVGAAVQLARDLE